MSYKKISKCKVCSSNHFKSVIQLGKQSYTGIFLKSDKIIDKVPLEIVSCQKCGLVQIAHDYNLELMYGDEYGYRSSQNSWMINHLRAAVDKMTEFLLPGDLVVEIGSNDATALSFFPKDCNLIGVDPSARPLHHFYPPNSKLIVEFFSEETVNTILKSDGKAKLVMSFAMFYDLPDPIKFAKNVASVLRHDGTWVFEQSYLLSMLSTGAFDTICHEHLEYYRLKDIEKILDTVDMKVVDVLLNDANGGSFRVTAAKNTNTKIPVSKAVYSMREREKKEYNVSLIQNFLHKVEDCRIKISQLVEKCKEEDLNLYGIGASTKGNVLLQYCNLTSKEVCSIGEVNSDKIGKVCPGSAIPIVSEDEILSDENGIFLILPWHFKDFFIKSPKFKNKQMVFPLPIWEEV